MQESLFSRGLGGGEVVRVTIAPTFDAFRVAARRLLAADVEPARVVWRWDEDMDPARPEIAGALVESTAAAAADEDRPRVPRRFAREARSAVCYRAEDRFDLVYRLLWRLAAGEPHLLERVADPQVRRLLDRAKAVRRDIHKMHAFVRFRRVEDPEGERYIAWFEPTHWIVRPVADFFVDRFASMRFSILTPDLCLHWEGDGAPWFSPGTTRDAAPAADALDEAWRTYYRSIFNPARLKVTAMRSEMPVKYWKNLPEARLIPELVRGARDEEDAMRRRRADADTRRCGPLPTTPAQRDAAERAAAMTGRARSALEIRACDRCDLHAFATQPVYGEGPARARVMIIGEQPGDREDLAGRPFVGPAGQVLDAALRHAALPRDQLYLTNAVKHFKFEPRGKRRLHKRPDQAEIDACLTWLERELDEVDPEVIICLGVTAARALLGRTPTIARERGTLRAHDGRQVLITAHPAAILRAQESQAAAFQALCHDLAQVTAYLARTPAPRPPTDQT